MARRRIVSVAFAYVGLLLLFTPEAFRSPGYVIIAGVAPLRLWGAAWLTVAIVAAIPAVPRHAAVALIAGQVLVWASGLAVANVTGDATTPIAFVPWLLLTALVFDAARRPA